MRSAVLIGLVLAQIATAPQSPTRDAPPPRAGTGVISGLVTAADTGLPLPRASVTLLPSGAGIQGSPENSVTTDGTGRFTFFRLPAGTYRLRAAPGSFRGQYLMSAYRGQRPTEAGEPLALAEGQRIEHANIALPRAGAIAGRVVDELGEPIARMTVYTARALPVNAGFHRTGVGDTTDDLGRFRVYGLEPGDYIVAAERRGAPGDASAAREPEGFARTFYPSALWEGEAGRVKIGPGGETAEIQIQIHRTRMLRLAGMVLDSRGKPQLHAEVALARGAAGDGTVISHQVSVGQAGRFAIGNIAGGNYHVVVKSRDTSGGSLPRLEYAVIPINLVSDVDDLVVETAPGVSVDGEVVFAEGAPAEPPGGLRINALPGDRVLVGDTYRSADVGADLRFTLTDAWAPLVISVAGIPRGHAVKSVMLGQTDITDQPVQFKAGDSGRLRVVLTSRVGSLAGQITDDTGAAASRATLYVIPEDRSAWRLRSGRFRIIGGFKEGRFTVNALLPGRYHLVALPAGETGISGDLPPAFFESLIELGTEVVVADGETRTIDLRLAKRGP
jgi:hypothetical protein